MTAAPYFPDAGRPTAPLQIQMPDVSQSPAIPLLGKAPFILYSEHEVIAALHPGARTNGGLDQIALSVPSAHSEAFPLSAVASLALAA